MILNQKMKNFQQSNDVLNKTKQQIKRILLKKIIYKNYLKQRIILINNNQVIQKRKNLLILKLIVFFKNEKKVYHSIRL